VVGRGSRRGGRGRREGPKLGKAGEEKALEDGKTIQSQGKSFDQTGRRKKEIRRCGKAWRGKKEERWRPPGRMVKEGGQKKKTHDISKISTRIKIYSIKSDFARRNPRGFRLLSRKSIAKSDISHKPVKPPRKTHTMRRIVNRTKKEKGENRTGQE